MADALESPKGMRVYSYSPDGVLNALLATLSSCSLRRLWRQPEVLSKTLMYLAGCTLFRYQR